MLKKEKEKIINELAESLSNCSIVIATDYRGLTAKEMVQLRRQLTDMGIEYRVAKNTLTRFAAEKAGKQQFNALLSGPLAMAFGYDDIVKPAKVLNEYIRASASVLQIKGAMLGDRLLGRREVSLLATTPPRDILISQLLGQLQAPLQALHNVISAPLRGFVYILQARTQQLEGGESDRKSG